MRYVEMLSTLDPATSTYIAQMLDSGRRVLTVEQIELSALAKDQRCPKCRGRGRVRNPDLSADAEKKWLVCPSCFGSKKRGGTVTAGSRSHRRDAVHSVERVAFAVSEMPDYWFRAAMVLATHDETMRVQLIRDIQELIIEPSKWEGMDDRSTLGLSRVVSYNVMLRDQQYIEPRRGAELMCVPERTWYRTWMPRSKEATERARGWIASADDHMSRRLYDAA